MHVQITKKNSEKILLNRLAKPESVR